jgi:hypothetical protein
MMASNVHTLNFNTDLSPPLEETLLQAFQNLKNDWIKGPKYMHGIWICHMFCHYLCCENTILKKGKTTLSLSICHNHHDVCIIPPPLEKSRPWLLVIPQMIVSLKHCISNFHLTTMKNHDWLYLQIIYRMGEQKFHVNNTIDLSYPISPFQDQIIQKMVMKQS